MFVKHGNVLLVILLIERDIKSWWKRGLTGFNNLKNNPGVNPRVVLF
jgi:hypothetical protein